MGLSPSSAPSQVPSLSPSSAPSHVPSSVPSSAPSQVPSLSPSSAPSQVPSLSPSSSPVPLSVPSSTRRISQTMHTVNTRSPTASTYCSSVGDVNAFCDIKGEGAFNGFSRFWEVKAGDVATMKCTGNTCELKDCCELGPKRKCANTNKYGLKAGGFTQADCDGSSLPWILKSSQDLKDSP